MSTDHVELRTGAYADSVTLLQVSRQVQQLPGVVTAQVAMATPLNVEVLERMGFTIPGDATVNHLVVAVRLDDANGLDGVRAEVDRALTDSRRAVAGPSAEAAPRTTGAALLRDPGAVVLVSVPGPSAAVEAVDALEAGSDVMIFSDHVPVEQEVALKSYAAERDLLVMGPDCGTAVVDGVGLGFANVVAPGPVGIVAASGTGCQQVLALLDHAGVGVAAAYGVGGRDLSAAVGGLSTRTALAGSTPTLTSSSRCWSPSHPPTRSPRPSRRTPTGWAPRSSRRCWGPGDPTSPPPPRRCCAGSATTCRRGRWPVAPSPGAAPGCTDCSSAAPSRRRPRCCARRPPRTPRWSTSVTTTTPRAAPTR